MEQARDQFKRFTSLFDSSSAKYDFIGKFLEEINTFPRAMALDISRPILKNDDELSIIFTQDINETM